MKSGRKRRAAKKYFAHPRSLVESKDIGARTRIWAFAHVMHGARIGANCNIGDHAFIESGARLGNNVTVKNGVSVWTGVTAENDVFIGPNCVFTNDPNPRAFIKKAVEEFETTRIRSGATLGANATLLCGITVGKCAFIGAGAVVLHSVPDYALIVGNPGRQVGWTCECAHRLALEMPAALGAMCVCSHCQKEFVRVEEGLRLRDAGDKRRAG